MEFHYDPIGRSASNDRENPHQCIQERLKAFPFKSGRIERRRRKAREIEFDYCCRPNGAFF
jgi:hypothetical protein